MNQSDINGFLLCLSRMGAATVSTDNERNHNNSIFRDNVHDHDHEHFHEHEHDHEHEHNDNDNDAHAVIMAKATAMLVLFCATAICGATPFVLNRHFKWTETNTNARSAIVVKCLLYFGGGVLLCTTFLHLLPEVRESVESLQGCGTFPTMEFPFVELLMCAGFFVMFFIEELIHTYIHRNQNILDEETVAFERGHSIRNSYVIRNNGAGDGDKCHQEEGCGSTQMWDCPPRNGSGTFKTLSPRDLYSSDMIENQKHHHHHNNHQRTHQQPGCHPAESTTVTTVAHLENSQQTNHNSHSHNHNHSHHNHSHHHQHSHLPLNKENNGDDELIASSLRGLLIVLALSVHELFEGLAIGLEGSASNVWFMFAAVSAHKLVLAFCVGVELIVARTRTHLSILFVFTFAVVSPIGIGIGMLVSNHNTTASSIPSAILQGLACGTLLYVVFFEILSKDRSGLLAYLALIVGFGLMFGLQQLVSGHHHSHGGCHSHNKSDLETHHDDSKHLSDASNLNLEKQLQILRELQIINN